MTADDAKTGDHEPRTAEIVEQSGAKWDKAEQSGDNREKGQGYKRKTGEKGKEDKYGGNPKTGEEGKEVTV